MKKEHKRNNAAPKAHPSRKAQSNAFHQPQIALHHPIHRLRLSVFGAKKCFGKLDWEEQWACALDPETAKRIRDERKPEHDDTCSMCGKFCAVRSMNKALNNEMVDIL